MDRRRGNLIGYIAATDPADAAAHDYRYRSTSAAGPGVATRVLAHMDELSMLVKRAEPDGTLHLTPLGTMQSRQLWTRPSRGNG